MLHRVDDRWHWSAESYPADEVSLRTINPENVVVVDTTDAGNHRVIAEVDWDSAFTTVHDGAIYMVESQQYHVDKLDLERKKAYVHKVEVDYYTDAMTYTNVRVIDDFAKKPGKEIIVEHGEVQVVSKVVGYKKIKFYTSENVGYGDVNLPEKDMHTTSYWFTIPWDRLAGLSYNQEEIIDGLAGLAYSLHHLAAMMLMADIHDIDRCIGDKSGEWFVRKDRNWRTITTTPAGEEGARPDDRRLRSDDLPLRRLSGRDRLLRSALRAPRRPARTRPGSSSSGCPCDLRLPLLRRPGAGGGPPGEGGGPGDPGLSARPIEGSAVSRTQVERFGIAAGVITARLSTADDSRLLVGHMRPLLAVQNGQDPFGGHCGHGPRPPPG